MGRGGSSFKKSGRILKKTLKFNKMKTDYQRLTAFLKFYKNLKLKYQSEVFEPSLDQYQSIKTKFSTP